MITIENLYSDTEFDLNRISKNIDNSLIYENSLNLISPKRVIIDNSTDVFIKTFFSDDKNYYLFLNLVNTLDIFLKYHVNTNLVKTGNKPLFGHEEINVFFKGGNVMYYHFTKKLTDENVKSKFKDFFKKSDFDFNVTIHTDSDYRFQTIRKITYECIDEFLSIVSKMFDTYLDSVMNNKKMNKMSSGIPENFHDPTMTDIVKDIINRSKTLIGMSEYDLAMPIIKKTMQINGMSLIPRIEKIVHNQTNIEIVMEIGDRITIDRSDTILDYLKGGIGVVMRMNNFIDIYNGFVVDKLMLLYKECSVKSKYHSMLLHPYYLSLIDTNFPNIFTSYMSQIIMYNFDLIVENNFYNKSKIDELFAGIKEGLAALSGKTFYSKNDSNPPSVHDINNQMAYDRYSVDPSINNIDNFLTFEKRNNFTAYNKPFDGLMVEKDNEIAYHYISRNLTIKSVLPNEVNNFDLYRIKMNIVANNVIRKNEVIKDTFKIPSEFIDVSITQMGSSQYGEDEEIYIMSIELNDINILNNPVKTHSYVYFIKDLNRILFVSDNFFPWKKQKYEKRLKRLFLLLHLYDMDHVFKFIMIIHDYAKHIKNCMETNEFRKFKKIKYYVDIANYKNYQVIQDMVVVDKKFSLVKDLIGIMGIIETLSKLNDNQRLNVINHFRQNINFSTITQKDVENLSNEFEIFIDEIIKSCNMLS